MKTLGKDKTRSIRKERQEQSRIAILEGFDKDKKRFRPVDTAAADPKLNKLLLPVDTIQDPLVGAALSFATAGRDDVLAARRDALVKAFQVKPGDHGSATVQVALLTLRIQSLMEHLVYNRKDFTSQRALAHYTARRRTMMNYLRRTDVARFRNIVEALKLPATPTVRPEAPAPVLPGSRKDSALRRIAQSQARKATARTLAPAVPAGVRYSEALGQASASAVAAAIAQRAPQ